MRKDIVITWMIHGLVQTSVFDYSTKFNEAHSFMATLLSNEISFNVEFIYD